MKNLYSRTHQAHRLRELLQAPVAPTTTAPYAGPTTTTTTAPYVPPQSGSQSGSTPSAGPTTTTTTAPYVPPQSGSQSGSTPSAGPTTTTTTAPYIPPQSGSQSGSTPTSSPSYVPPSGTVGVTPIQFANGSSLVANVSFVTSGCQYSGTTTIDYVNSSSLNGWNNITLLIGLENLASNCSTMGNLTNLPNNIVLPQQWSTNVTFEMEGCYYNGAIVINAQNRTSLTTNQTEWNLYLTVASQNSSFNCASNVTSLANNASTNLSSSSIAQLLSSIPSNLAANISYMVDQCNYTGTILFTYSQTPASNAENAPWHANVGIQFANMEIKCPNNVIPPTLPPLGTTTTTTTTTVAPSTTTTTQPPSSGQHTYPPSGPHTSTTKAPRCAHETTKAPRCAHETTIAPTHAPTTTCSKTTTTTAAPTYPASTIPPQGSTIPPQGSTIPPQGSMVSVQTSNSQMIYPPLITLFGLFALVFA